MGKSAFLFRYDARRFGGFSLLRFLRSHALRYLWLLRKAQGGGLFARFLLGRMTRRYGLEIPYTATIGAGLYLGHAYGITVNPGAVIGRNCNLHKGVTIGRENRDRRKGCPTLGNCVWVGACSTIVGKISIGDDVLIAPNTYVNCDVPSHSVVLGSPCKIFPREHATASYINNIVE